MAIEQKGPGGVSNSYGTRATTTPRQMESAGVLKPDYNEFREEEGTLSSSETLALRSLVGGSAGLADVTYDGSNKVTAFSAGEVTYTVAYASGSITVTGSDESVVTISLDGSGRISGASVT